MSQVTVNVAEPSIVVPSTDAPDTGVMTDVLSGVGAGILGVVAIFAVVLIIKKRHYLRIALRRRRWMPKILVALAVISAGVTFGVLRDYSGDSSVEAIDGTMTDDGYAISVTTSDVAMNVELDNEAVFETAASTVTIGTATTAGYTLGAYVTDSELTNEVSDDVISSSTGTITNPAGLVDNSWGVSTSAPSAFSDETFFTLSGDESNPTVLKSTSEATAEGDETTLYYGVYVAPGLDYGTYTGATVNYIAVVNIGSYLLAYDGNGATDGTMDGFVNNFTSDGDDQMLLAPNFYKTGYGFAGWSSNPEAVVNGSDKIYGPNEEINKSELEFEFSGGDMVATVYATWLRSAGTMQDFAGCFSLAINEVTALTDARDDNVYTVGRLADGNCWMLENLRLDAENSNDGTLAQGYGGEFVGLADSEDANFGTRISSRYVLTGNLVIYRYPRYNNNNTNIGGSNSDGVELEITPYDTDDDHSQWYGYGNYYTFAAAVADTSEWTDVHAGDTSICPSGWKLPTVGSVGKSFTNLDIALGGTGEPREETNASNIWRAYPNNLVLAGSYDGVSHGRGVEGFYASNAGYIVTSFFGPEFERDAVSPYMNSVRRTNGVAVRCVAYENYEYMQDQTAETLDTLMPNDGDTALLYDKRDEQEYPVAKIGGNYWMAKNLNLAGGATLTSELSNVETDFYLPASGEAEEQDGYAVRVYNSDGTECVSNQPCYSYYSYYAVTAGSGGEDAVLGEDVTQDICPKGWRLPSFSEYSTLGSNYNVSTLINDPFNFVTSGAYYDNFDNGGAMGLYWTSSLHSSNGNAGYMYFFGWSSGSFSVSYNGNSRQSNTSMAVRCIADI